MPKQFGVQQPDVWLILLDGRQVGSVLPDRQAALDAADAAARLNPGVDVFVYRCNHKGTSRAETTVPVNKAAF